MRGRPMIRQNSNPNRRTWSEERVHPRQRPLPTNHRSADNSPARNVRWSDQAGPRTNNIVVERAQVYRTENDDIQVDNSPVVARNF